MEIVNKGMIEMKKDTTKTIEDIRRMNAMRQKKYIAKKKAEEKNDDK